MNTDQESRPGRGEVSISPAAAIGSSASLIGLLFAILTGSRIAQLVVVIGIGLILTSMQIQSMKRVLVAVMLVELPIQIDIYLGFDNAVAANNTTSGFNLSITTACLLVLYLLWGSEALAFGPKYGRTSLVRDMAPTLTYFAIVVISTTVALNVVYAWYEIVLLGQAVLLFIYLLHWTRSRRDAFFLLDVLVAGVLFQGLIVVWLKLGGGAGILSAILRGNQFAGRLGGTIGHPNSLGTYLTLLLPLCLGVVVVGGPRWRRNLAGSALVFGVIALIMTGSRGSWLGSTLAFGTFVVVGQRGRWMPRRLIWAMAAGAVLIAVVAGGDIISRADGFTDAAAQSRLPLNQLAFTVIQDQPILGVGANNFAESMQSYLTVDFSRAWIATVHNKYLLVLAETGIVGFMAFLWFLGSTLRAGWWAAKFGDVTLRPVVLGLTVGVMGAMAHMMVAIHHSRIHIHLLWIVAALILVLRRFSATTSESHHDRSEWLDHTIESG